MARLEDLGVARPLVWYNGAWSPGRTGYDQNVLPQSLVDKVIADGVASRMIVDAGDEKNIVVGYPLATGDQAYFEFFSLDEVDNTLQSVRLSLVLGTMITTALGVLAGSFAARRAVRPVGVAAQAAKAIAGGRLDTRLEPTEDPDLSVLANSFNDMAAALQSRIERDARFASDVSHELRSPLMTLSASVEVMDARRARDARARTGGTRPAQERRDPVPGPRRRPARDQPIRCGRGAAPHGRADRVPNSSVRPSASAACRRRRSPCHPAPKWY